MPKCPNELDCFCAQGRIVPSNKRPIGARIGEQLRPIPYIQRDKEHMSKSHIHNSRWLYFFHFFSISELLLYFGGDARDLSSLIPLISSDSYKPVTLQRSVSSLRQAPVRIWRTTTLSQGIFLSYKTNP
jgi:hypothetical protein